MATVPIPDRLRAFLSEVRDLIGRGDEAAILPSDDLLQSDDAYGGLTNDGDYSFVFFPGAGVRTKWEIRLRRDEISAIADGQMVALQLWRCHEESCGSMFASSTDLCFDCDYVDDNPDRLPKGRFDTRRDWALAYFSLQPEAHPFQLIGAYNSQPQLAEKLGLFSLDEATEILAHFQRGSRS